MEENAKHLKVEELAIVADALQIGDINSLKKEWQDHFSNCSECRTAILEILEIAEASKLKSTEESKVTSKNYFKWYAAASVLILLGFLSWSTFRAESYRHKLKESQEELNAFIQQEIDEGLSGKTLEKAIPETNEKLKAQLDSALNENKELKEKESLFNIAYQDNPVMEEQRNLALRSGSVDIIEPNKTDLAHAEPISFRWKNKQAIVCDLLLYNNRNTLVYQKGNLKDHHSLSTEKLLPGTYYWKLVKSEKVVFIGKFKLL